MKILGIIDAKSGPCYHRVQLPLLNMDGPDVYLTNFMREEDIEKGFDIVNISRYSFHNPLHQILDWKRKYGFKLIVDVDDYWQLDRHHILHDDWVVNKTGEMIVSFIRSADAVTCTHERLAAEAKQFNKNVHVFPNAIPYNYKQFTTQKTESEKVRLFWQGSNTHRKDIELLRNPLKRVWADAALRDKIHMVFCGYNASKNHTVVNPDGTVQRVQQVTQCEEMVSAYTNGFRLNGSVFENKPLDHYYEYYKYCDIALIPLVESRFNSFKSNLKILEAANIGAPVIVSAVHPYLGFPATSVKYVYNQMSWHKNISMLVKNKGMAGYTGQYLQQYCREHFNFYKINNERKQFFESLIGVYAD